MVTRLTLRGSTPGGEVANDLVGNGGAATGNGSRHHRIVEVVGVYLSPAQSAVAFSVDRKANRPFHEAAPAARARRRETGAQRAAARVLRFGT